MPKLTKFKEKEENNNLKNMIIAASIIVAGLFSFFIYKSYAAYKIERKYDVIKARIGEFGMPSCEISGNPSEYVENATLTIEITNSGKNGIAEEGYSWDGVNYSTNNTLNVTENGTYVGFIKDTKGNVKTCSVKVDKIEDIQLGGTLMAANDSQAFWQYKANITKIVFENKLLPKENATYTFDVSKEQDGSVMSYLVANESDSSTYTTYIQANEKIVAENCFSLFSRFTKLTDIEGLEYLDTSNATTMNTMFYYCNSLTILDVSHFDTSKVTNMQNMFSNCKSLTRIEGLENFNTQNVTNMTSMFVWCSSLRELNVSSFNTGKVEHMEQMFGGCSSLLSLDVSNFDTKSAHSMRSLFSGCSNLKELNAKNLTIRSESINDTSEYMFFGCSSLINLDLSNASISTFKTQFFTNMPSSAIIKVKDVDTQQKILNLSSSDRPASWTTENVIVAS